MAKILGLEMTKKQQTIAGSAIGTGIVAAALDTVVPKAAVPWLYAPTWGPLPIIEDWVLVLAGVASYGLDKPLKGKGVLQNVGAGSLLYSVPKFVYDTIVNLVPVASATPVTAPPSGTSEVFSVGKVHGKYVVTG